jgi:hypothetical protein
MKKPLITIWLTLLCFLLLGNVQAWEIPAYLRVSSGSRIWFTMLEGDLIQKDRTKLDLTENLGIKKDKLVWEFYSNLRFDNIHVVRLRLEPNTDYDESRQDSSQKILDARLGYDLDFYMTPQALFGANVDLGYVSADTRVRNVTVGNALFNYHVNQTRFVPMLGVHGAFYPILEGIALRPNVFGRVNWWNYESLESWDWEVGAAVDVPVNRLWTWTVNGGYRFWHMKFQREIDNLDVNRSGFFVETSVLF